MGMYINISGKEQVVHNALIIPRTRQELKLEAGHSTECITHAGHLIVFNTL